MNLVKPKVDLVKICVGSGETPLYGYVNIDANPNLPADLHQVVPPLPFGNESASEIYAGHFLEHLSPEEAGEFLNECHRVLIPDGKLGIVVPDTHEIMKRYLNPSLPARAEFPIGVWHDLHDLNAICALFLYSTLQDSQHQWSYDLTTLERLLNEHGFTVIGEINRWLDQRLGTGQWFQCGLDAVKRV